MQSRGQQRSTVMAFRTSKVTCRAECCAACSCKRWRLWNRLGLRWKRFACASHGGSTYHSSSCGGRCVQPRFLQSMARSSHWRRLECLSSRTRTSSSHSERELACDDRCVSVANERGIAHSSQDDFIDTSHLHVLALSVSVKIFTHGCSRLSYPKAVPLYVQVARSQLHMWPAVSPLCVVSILSCSASATV